MLRGVLLGKSDTPCVCAYAAIGTIKILFRHVRVVASDELYYTIVTPVLARTTVSISTISGLHAIRIGNVNVKTTASV